MFVSAAYQFTVVRHGHRGLPRPQQPVAQNSTRDRSHPVTSTLTTTQIRTELEFLCDTGVISAQQLSSILSQLPAQTPLRAPLAAPIHASATSTPVEQLSDMSLKDPYTHTTSPAPLPPPAYAQSPPVLAIASALYAYQPTDTGDLALQPNDNIQVTEHMNNDCKSVKKLHMAQD